MSRRTFLAVLAGVWTQVWKPGASAAALFQEPELIDGRYLSKRFIAPAKAPSRVVIAGKKEPGERMIVTGQVLDGATSIVGASIYVFNADAKGLYTRDGWNDDLRARLHGAMRSDATGHYQFETIRPHGYDDLPAHVHYVVNAPNYKPRFFTLWLADDPILEERRKAGLPGIPLDVPDMNAVCPVERDADGVWQTSRNLQMIRQ